MEFALIIVAAGLAALVLRLFQLWRRRRYLHQGFTGDAAFHYAVVRTIARTGRYDGVEEFLISDRPDTYPSLFHHFAAWFPIGLIGKAQFVPNLILFCAATMLFAAYLLYLGAVVLAVPPIPLAIIGLTVFLLSTTTLMTRGTCILYVTLGERLLARMAAAFFFLFLGVGIGLNDMLSLALAVPMGALALLTSMFSRQAILFVTPLVALFMPSWWPVGVLAGALAIAFALQPRKFFAGIRDQARFLELYRRYTKRSWRHGRWVSRYFSLDRWRKTPRKFEEFETTEPGRLLLWYPETVVAALFLALGTIPGGGAFAAIFLASLLVYVLVSTPWLCEFGEAGRYLEYNLYLLSPVALALMGIKLGLILISVPLALLASVGCAIIHELWWVNVHLTKGDVMATLLKNAGIGESSTVFGIPVVAGSLCHARTGCRALMYQGASLDIPLFQRFMDEMGFLRHRWHPLFQEHGVTHVVADRTVLTMLEERGEWRYPLDELEKIAEDDHYIVWRVPHQEGSPP